MEKENKLEKVGNFVSSTISKIVNAVIVVLIIALVGVIGWFWHNNEILKTENEILQENASDSKNELKKVEEKSKDLEVKNVEVKEVKEVKNEIVTKNNKDFQNTSNWKTHNLGYLGHIQFKYPENWNTKGYFRRLKEKEDSNQEKNSVYIEEGVCESMLEVEYGDGGGVSIVNYCSAEIQIVPKFSSKGCVDVEYANYKLCPPEYSDSDLLDIFRRSAVFTKGTEEFMLSFEASSKKEEHLSQEQIEEKYSSIYKAIFDSVEIKN
jgi:hypothetical protein